MAKLVSIVVFLSSLCLLASMDEKDRTRAVPDIPADTLPAKLQLEMTGGGFEDPPEIPADNPMSDEKVQLGRKLFFDPILSADKTVACASCHQPEHGFASPDPVAIGIKGAKGKRNAPSLFNRAYGKIFLWDGSAKSLEEQALTPIGNPDELGGSIEEVVAALRADQDYVTLFRTAFGKAGEAITATKISQAIACFERTLVLPDSKVDRFRAAEYGAISQEARQGLWIFESRGRCWKCHSGPNLTDEEFHNTGVGFGLPKRDEGRLTVTKQEEHRFQFKTPSLRGIRETAPFMHDGSMKTLREVVEFYNKGGAPNDAHLDKQMKPLNLTDEEIGFVVEFLKALSE